MSFLPRSPLQSPPLCSDSAGAHEPELQRSGEGVIARRACRVRPQDALLGRCGDATLPSWASTGAPKVSVRPASS